MRKIYLLVVMFLTAALCTNAQQFTYLDSWGNAGFNLTDAAPTGVQVVFSVPGFTMEDQMVQGVSMKSISMPGTFLFNDQGMPNLPGKGAYIAIPQGSVPKLKVVAQRTDLIHNVEIAPAPRIPLDSDKSPLDFTPNVQVYSTNAWYPAEPVIISEINSMRGVDVITLGITPFQYNPVTKDLLVYKDLKVEIVFEGGNGQFGDLAYRNRFWDPILKDNLMNYSSLPKIDYNKFQASSRNPMNDECEYIIISPTGPDFLSWADSIKNFRIAQGIITKVFTTAEVGGNTTTAIEAFIDNAYNNWTLKPVACLLLGDYGSDGTKNIISPLEHHGAGYPDFASDNKYADVTGDYMPDVVFSRIVGNNGAELQILCSKFLSYERNPPVDPDFYDKPITALGWQTERWFQLCSEIVGGFFRNEYNKHPRRINAIYQGTPGTTWSSATNTSTIVNYFGPSGLDYIPQQPNQMPCCWNGGTATQINQGIDSGAFMLMHRDHGAYTEWGEPAYNNSWALQLQNTNLTFIFSINCETGAYHRSTDCLGEKFYRQYKNGHNAGSLGFVAPTETSYSFVNDTFVWGMMDNMWPNFMPQEGTEPASRGVMPAFAQAAGKYFLKRSNWPYNSGDKLITYKLFHMHGDAFSVLYYEVPTALDVTHDSEIAYGSTTFSIQTNDSAFIALTLGEEILATGYGSASGPIVLTIPVVPVGSQVLVTVTKQNFFRYSAFVPVTSPNVIANFTASATNVCVGSTVNFSDMSSGSPTYWNWNFQGGTPSTSVEQNPSGILYNTPGTYDVTLTATKNGANPSTMTKTGYITVYNLPEADFSNSDGCPGSPVQFTDMSNPNGGTLSGWMWIFGDAASGSNDTSYLQNPTHTFTDAGTYSVTLEATINGVCKDITVKEVVILTTPETAAKPTGETTLCKDGTNINFTTTGAAGASTYTWITDPENAGTFTGNGTTASLSLAAGYTGLVAIKVQGVNNCGNGAFSEELSATVIEIPSTPVKPSGVDSVNLNKVDVTDFTTTEVSNATTYAWSLTPTSAGAISGNGLTGSATWDKSYRGIATIAVKAVNTCGESVASEVKEVKLYAPVGMNENEGAGIRVIPNPNNGRFNLVFNTQWSASVDITIVNALGVTVYAEKNLNLNGKTTYTLDLTNVAKGIYTLKAEGQGLSKTVKVVISE